MAKQKTQDKPKAPDAGADKKAPETPRPNLPMTRTGFEIRNIDEGYRFAQYLAESGMVPDSYRGKPNDCLVALDLSARLGAPWLAIMQHVYIVHGRVGIDAALSTGLTNRSGIFMDPLEFEVVGDDPDNDSYRVRAFATRKSTGTKLFGPWITWKIVRAEGWDKDKKSKTSNYVQTSKWKTMPEQMFHYRAATWFQRRHCPEVTMGMLTLDEAEDVGPRRHVDATVVEPGNEGLKKLLADREKANGNGDNAKAEAETEDQAPNEKDDNVQPDEPEPVEEDLQDQQTKSKVAQQKEKLGVGTGNGGKKSNLF